jgi:hypothetical protein
MSKILKQIIARVIVGVILLIIQNLVTGWPLESLWVFNNHRIVDISHSDPSLFKINDIRTDNDRLLYLGDKFSYKSILPFRHTDIPLSISGTTSYNDGANVWCVCRDREGLYYLQNPNVYIRNTQSRKWFIDNVYPLDKITLIIFISVDSAGNEIFRQKVIRKDWDGFPELPANKIEIASIRLGRYFNK